MNIFILSTDPDIAAQMLCDKHIVKQVLESAQILSTVTGGPYKPTHRNHPCVIWASENYANFSWLVLHGLALSREYTYRYGKFHRCHDVIKQIRSMVEPDESELTPFVQCMPEIYRGEDPVAAYRQYYHSKTFATWERKRPAPHWWRTKNESNT